MMAACLATLKPPPREADNARVSLFDSLYGENPIEPAPDPSAVSDASDASAPDDAIAPYLGAPGGLGEAELPLAGPSSPTMSLQDFAAEVFGKRQATPGTAAFARSLEADAGALLAEASEAFNDGWANPTLIDGPTPTASPVGDAPSFDGGTPYAYGSAAEGDPSPAPSPVGTLAPRSPFDTSFESASPVEAAVGPDTGVAGEPFGPDGSGPFEADPSFDMISLVGDDLLPTRRPKRSVGLPDVKGELAPRTKTILLVAVALVAGFLGYKTFLGGNSAATPPSSDVSALPGSSVAGSDQSGVAGPEAAGTPLGAIEPAQLVAAESELRTAALEAQASFSESGSYAQDTAAWDALIDQPVVGLGDPLAAGTFQVVSDPDAACFQTATATGAGVAVGVTASGLTFASDEAGSSLCTADAGVLSSWDISLSPLG